MALDWLAAGSSEPQHCFYQSHVPSDELHVLLVWLPPKLAFTRSHFQGKAKQQPEY
jgi:hypothetical protein